MDAVARLERLLPLVNGEELPERAVRQRLLAFLHEIELPGIRRRPDEGLWAAHYATASELRATQRKLQTLFESGFRGSEFELQLPYWAPGTDAAKPGEFDDPIPAQHLRQPLAFPSLRFGGEYIPGKRARWSFCVTAGRLRDLVPYFALWMLTRGDIKLRRCMAPAKRHWSRPCGRFFIASGVGRHWTVCSKECADRKKDKRKNELMKELLRAHTVQRKALEEKSKSTKRRTKK